MKSNSIVLVHRLANNDDVAGGQLAVFQGASEAPISDHTGRASNAEKQPTGPGPEGCVENGPAAALLVGYVSIQICALLAPCRRPILNATTLPLYERRYTSWSSSIWFAQRRATFDNATQASDQSTLF